MNVPSQGQNSQVPAGSAVKEHDTLLFKPKQYRSITLHNRVVVSPMCQYIALY